jgi:hypothetical protein
MKYKTVLPRTAALIACATSLAGISSAGLADTTNPQLQKRRAEVLAAGQKGAVGLPILTAAMKEPNAMIRRAAVRAMLEIGSPAIGALTQVLKDDSDMLVRRTALRALLELSPGTQAVNVAAQALNDPDETLRTAAVEALADMRPHSPEVVILLEKAQQDKAPSVSRVASQALWPFKKEGITLREAPQWKDAQLTVVQTIPLAENGWRFQTDTRQTGHKQKWFDTGFNDSSWQNISINKAWEEQIGQSYDGVGWYRLTFTLPEKPAQAGTDIVFDSVDESAWIWINGEYVGQHDIGTAGWNKRFAMDVSDLLKWGGQNQITVRVLDRMQAGGIWKPVYLEVLKR